MAVKIEKFSPLAVNRVKKKLTVKEVFPRFATFKEGTKLTYGCVFYFPASVAVRTLGKAPFRC